ncbi:hypothetical protein VPH35_055997 [Triticum aestivum]
MHHRPAQLSPANPSSLLAFPSLPFPSFPHTRSDAPFPSSLSPRHPSLPPSPPASDEPLPLRLPVAGFLPPPDQRSRVGGSTRAARRRSARGRSLFVGGPTGLPSAAWGPRCIVEPLLLFHHLQSEPW